MTWEPADLLIAYPDGPVKRPGYEHGGLGMWLELRASPKGKRRDKWSLTHLGTGLRVCHIHGRVADAFPIASRIAAAFDWTFDGIGGWKNRDPEFPDKLVKLLGTFGKDVSRGPSGMNQYGECYHRVARQIAEARA